MSAELAEKLDMAILKMAEQVKAQPDPQKALHFSQSALNLAHVKNVLCLVKSDKPAAEAKTSEPKKLA
jgi:hypothetical protein